MPYSFNQAVEAFKNDQIKELSEDSKGLRFLKLRSLSRSEYMRRVVEEYELDAESIGNRQLLKFLFESDLTDEQIDSIIGTIFSEERLLRKENEDDLVSELYRINSFDWGGLHQNSLERTIVDRYVKKITSFDELSDKIENDLHQSMRSYVLCSWYNHWTSIIIEDIFRDHDAVLPAVGLIKKVDFFINNIPFDLKVTYMPAGFIKDVRRNEGLRPELTILKGFCRNNNISYDNNMPEARLLEDLWIKVADHPSSEGNELMRELKDKRTELIENTISDPSNLIVWLYENQGVRRFDSSNRLFLVLINRNNLFESWKLKRAKPLLTEKIHNKLNGISDNPGREINFDWEGTTYTTLSEVIFVDHNGH